LLLFLGSSSIRNSGIDMDDFCNICLKLPTYLRWRSAAACFFN
jgi:hypothetical protein